MIKNVKHLKSSISVANVFLNLQKKLIHSRKTNSLFNHQPYIDKTHLYAKDPFEPKYQFIIQKRESI